jgi:tRNA threonylcarbamoyladenosine biosynthesis protein TsaE
MTLAARVGSLLLPGDVVLLSGDLGAGKTTFVQGLAQGMGIDDPVTSPTFTLIQEYGSRARGLVHVDPYRLESEADVEGTGLDDYWGRAAVVAVEWSERLGSLTPRERLDVNIERLDSDRRRITLFPVGERYELLLEQVELC